MSYKEWCHQHIYRVMFTKLDESSDSAQDGLGPSEELCRLAFKQAAPTEVECIDPALLQLHWQQHVGQSRNSVSDHAVDCTQGTTSLESMSNFVSNTPQFLETIMETDEEFLEATELPVFEETDEQFFDRAEVQELVSIPDTPDVSEASPTMEIKVEPQGISSLPHPPISPALSSPLSSAPPSPVVDLYTETTSDSAVYYPVERIIQAWGPRDGRQYLIRWEGWSEEFDSWEPAVNVSEDLVVDFERSRLRRRLSHRRQRRQIRRWGY